MNNATIYYDKDVKEGILKNKVVSVIGYGNQGRSQALNMRDSGVENVIIGSRKDNSWHQANADGFKVYSIEEASKKSDIIFLLIPDEIAPEVFENKIRKNLSDGNVVNFASGYNITFDCIQPPEFIDVIMVAPRMIGQGVRDLYLNGSGAPAFVAVEQDYSNQAKDIMLALAQAIGATKSGAIEVSFEEETHLDLMAEQATWPLIISVINEVFKFQLKQGYSEEAVLMELLLSQEPAYILRKMAEVGTFKQLPLHSLTSQFGQMTRYDDIDKNYIKTFVVEAYENITSGDFANRWKEEQENGYVKFNKLQKELDNYPITKAEKRVKERIKIKED